MNKKLSILLATLALVIATLACAAGEMSLENPRMAFDEAGTQVTTTYSANDAFFVVADLNNAVKGTIVEPKWYVVNVEGVDPGPLETEESSAITIDEDYWSGYVSFQLTNGSGWLPGEYRAELYLNGALTHTVNFSVQ